MSPVVIDPSASLAQARLEDIAREVAADGLVREVRRAARAHRDPTAGGLPAVVRWLRGVTSFSFSAGRRGAPCPTC